MSKHPVKIDSVRYNAATQSFEAAVTVYGDRGTRSYACAIEAPITTTFAEAAEGLAVQAQRRYGGRGGLHSRRTAHVPRLRAGGRAFDPSRWLQGLLGKNGRSAA
jgi:hypothetical protein